MFVKKNICFHLNICFNKMGQQLTQLVVQWQFWEKCFLGMFSPCVVTSDAPHPILAGFNAMWFFFFGVALEKMYEHRPQTLEALRNLIIQKIAAIPSEMIRTIIIKRSSLSLSRIKVKTWVI